MLRMGYRYQKGATYIAQEERSTAYTGLAGGFGLVLPLGDETKLGLDYSYRATNPFKGVHALGIRVAM